MTRARTRGLYSAHRKTMPNFLIALTLVAALAPAQARTDFAGRWTTDPDPAAGTTGPAGAAGAGTSGAPGRAGGRGPQVGDMGSGWGPTITIAQNGAQLTVEY